MIAHPRLLHRPERQPDSRRLIPSRSVNTDRLGRALLRRDNRYCLDRPHIEPRLEIRHRMAHPHRTQRYHWDHRLRTLPESTDRDRADHSLHRRDTQRRPYPLGHPRRTVLALRSLSCPLGHKTHSHCPHIRVHHLRSQRLRDIPHTRNRRPPQHRKGPRDRSPHYRRDHTLDSSSLRTGRGPAAGNRHRPRILRIRVHWLRLDKSVRPRRSPHCSRDHRPGRLRHYTLALRGRRSPRYHDRKRSSDRPHHQRRTARHHHSRRDRPYHTLDTHQLRTGSAPSHRNHHHPSK